MEINKQAFEVTAQAENAATEISTADEDWTYRVRSIARKLLLRIYTAGAQISFDDRGEDEPEIQEQDGMITIIIHKPWTRQVDPWDVFCGIRAVTREIKRRQSL